MRNSKLIFISAGKSAVFSGQVSADLFLDCRVMWNPFRVFGAMTGDDPQVQDWVRNNNADLVASYKQVIKQALATRETRNSGRRDPDGGLKVCFFCLAGVHRSRGMKNVIAQDLAAEGGYDITIVQA